MNSTPSFWLVLLLLLSAPPGWYLAEKNKQHKAEAQAVIEHEQEVARQEFQRKRDLVAQNRAAAMGTRHERVALKNKKALEGVTIKTIHDDGITFVSESGVTRVTWAELPLDWVTKFCDPVTAGEAEVRSAGEAAQLAAVERLGREVQLAFVRELNPDSTTSVRGSIVKVLSVYKDGWKDVGGRKIFVMNLGQATFEAHPTFKMRIYPTGRQLAQVSNDKEKASLFVNSAAQALQISREAGIKPAELPKDQW